MAEEKIMPAGLWFMSNTKPLIAGVSSTGGI